MLSPKQKLKNPGIVNLFKGFIENTINKQEGNITYNTETDVVSEIDTHEKSEQEKLDLANHFRKSKFSGMMNETNKIVF